MKCFLLDIPRGIITEESDVKSRSSPFSNGNGFLLRDELIATKQIKSLGIEFLRFQDIDVRFNLDNVIVTI